MNICSDESVHHCSRIRTPEMSEGECPNLRSGLLGRLLPFTPCSISVNRRQPAIGLFISPVSSSRYSLSGGCCGCSFFEPNPEPRVDEWRGDVTTVGHVLRLQAARWGGAFGVPRGETQRDNISFNAELRSHLHSDQPICDESGFTACEYRSHSPCW
jgi:hypothetical protein